MSDSEFPRPEGQSEPVPRTTRLVAIERAARNLVEAMGSVDTLLGPRRYGHLARRYYRDIAQALTRLEQSLEPDPYEPRVTSADDRPADE